MKPAPSLPTGSIISLAGVFTLKWNTWDASQSLPAITVSAVPHSVLTPSPSHHPPKNIPAVEMALSSQQHSLVTSGNGRARLEAAVTLQIQPVSIHPLLAPSLWWVQGAEHRHEQSHVPPLPGALLSWGWQEQLWELISGGQSFHCKCFHVEKQVKKLPVLVQSNLTSWFPKILS